MNTHRNFDVRLELGKAKMRDFHRESEDAMLVKQSQRFQPGQTHMPSKETLILLKSVVLKIEKHFRSGHALREKHIVIRN